MVILASIVIVVLLASTVYLHYKQHTSEQFNRLDTVDRTSSSPPSANVTSAQPSDEGNTFYGYRYR